MIGDSLRAARRPPLLALGLGIVAASGLLLLVFVLGAWAYRYRRFSLHDGRLQRLVEQHPNADATTRGLLAEPGNREIPVPEGERQLAGLIARWAPARVDEVLAKKRRWSTVRIFGAGDMVYVLYFDAGGVLRDYVLLGN